MRNLPKVTQLVSGNATIHTQVCVMPRPILSTMRGQNMAQFCSQGSVMARFTLSPRYSAPLRKGAAERMFGLRCAHVSHSGNLPSCKRRTKSRRRGRPTCPFPISQCLEVPLPFHHQSVPPWPEERQQKGTHMLDLRP